MNLSVSQWKGTIGYSSGPSTFKEGEAGYWSMLSEGGSQAANDTKSGDYEAVVEGIDFLTNSPPEPFLLFLPTRGAHPPYGAPADFKNKISLADVKKHVSL